MHKKHKIRIGTRGSKLALAQADMVSRALLASFPDITTEIVAIKTTGDKILEKNLNEIGGKGLFIKEIEEKLLNDSIDIAVHSMKDMPALVHDELYIAAILEREAPNDALISAKAKRIEDLPKNAVVGTSSPRRASQALHMRPDIKIVPFRGNIHTRLQKIEAGEVDTTFLAIAGLKRCGIEDSKITVIDTKVMLPAVAQGAIGIEIKKGSGVKDMVAKLNHENTEICVNVERAFLKEFEGSCSTPIAALAVLSGDKLELNCLIASPDGKKILKTSRFGTIGDELESLGEDAAKELLDKAGEGFFDA